MSDVLRECLDELRMTVDSLEPMENDLLTVMGNLHLEGRLRKQGLRLECGNGLKRIIRRALPDSSNLVSTCFEIVLIQTAGYTQNQIIDNIVSAILPKPPFS